MLNTVDEGIEAVRQGIEKTKAILLYPVKK